MKTAIIYYSRHHGNTKKLVDGIAAAVSAPGEITAIDIVQNPEADLSEYDRIGIASGIYFGGFAKQIIAYAEEHLPEGKEVFFLYTHGSGGGDFLKGIREVTDKKQCTELGSYHCKGFDTFGPFKLVGGIAKGHPTEEEIAGAAAFYKGL